MNNNKGDRDEVDRLDRVDRRPHESQSDGGSVEGDQVDRALQHSGDCDGGSRGRTTASHGQSCVRCGRLLTGRKERFCSDRCRMASRRHEHTAKVSALLTTLQDALADLRDLVEGGGGRAEG